MASVFGNVLHLSIFGQSHSPAIGCSLDGIPAGIPVDTDELQAFLDRRAPGRDKTATARREADTAHLIAGIIDGHTSGAPIAGIIENTNTRSKDYSGLRKTPRPGHADFAARIKYGNFHDVAGGGHFSGRLTAPLCIAGGIAIQALKTQGVEVMAHVAQIGGTSDLPMDDMVYRENDRKAILENTLPCIDSAAAERMRKEIMDARGDLDSVGGIVECGVYGLPAGIGDPMFDGMENRIAKIAFGIPAVKGIEFGMGFAVAAMRGSENNDAFRIDPETGKPTMVTNNAGGILGGISSGTPIMWRMAVKPTPSIAREQDSVDLDAGENAKLEIHGRHDPCIVPRAVPVAEAAAALAVLDAMLEDGAFDIDRARNMAHRS